MTMVTERPNTHTRATILGACAVFDVLVFTGIVVKIHGPIGNIKVAMIVAGIVCMFGVVGGLVIAGVKLLRDATTPMWSYRDETGRKIHGFFAWWGTIAGLWSLLVITLYNVAHLASYLADFTHQAG